MVNAKTSSLCNLLQLGSMSTAAGEIQCFKNTQYIHRPMICFSICEDPKHIVSDRKTRQRELTEKCYWKYPVAMMLAFKMSVT